MVLDALEGDLVTKSDFDNFKQHVDHRFIELQKSMDHRFIEMQQSIGLRFSEFEFRIITRLGALTIGSLTIFVAVMSWIIKS